jgi:hypothetical protein
MGKAASKRGMIVVKSGEKKVEWHVLDSPRWEAPRHRLHGAGRIEENTKPWSFWT